MGALHYDGWVVDFDDRLLVHLQIAIISRLRQGESLLMSWANSTAIGSGRESLWISPTVPLRFTFAGSRTPAIDPAWVQRLTESAVSSTGLIVSDADGRPIVVAETLHRGRSSH